MEDVGGIVTGDVDVKGAGVGGVRRDRFSTASFDD